MTTSLKKLAARLNIWAVRVIWYEKYVSSGKYAILCYIQKNGKLYTLCHIGLQSGLWKDIHFVWGNGLHLNYIKLDISRFWSRLKEF